jgi:peptide/nickel transport system substrate-binding protein
VHVRKAANFIMDKAALVRARGGTFAGLVGEHIVPPEVLGALPPGEFDPYASEGHRGDLEKAKAEMRLSKYDTDKDGLCDAAACKNVLHMTRNTPPYTDMAPIEEASLRKIGITLVTRPQADFYSAVQVTGKTPPIGSGAGWGKDYADAGTFFTPLLSSGSIAKEATQNFSYVGLTREQAREFGVPYPAGGVPSIDADIERCQPRLIGDPRTECWAELDKKLMNEIVPWIPYNWATTVWTSGDAIAKWALDAFTDGPAFSHIQLDTTKQVAG